MKRNVEQALQALAKNLETADGKRMLYEDMVANNVVRGCANSPGPGQMVRNQ